MSPLRFSTRRANGFAKSDALRLICGSGGVSCYKDGFFFQAEDGIRDRKSTRLNSSHVPISYAVFCLKKNKFGVDDGYGAVVSWDYLVSTCIDVVSIDHVELVISLVDVVNFYASSVRTHR